MKVIYTCLPKFFALFLLLGFQQVAYATAPTVNQAPTGDTVDPSGTGMDLFVAWLESHGNADVVPAEDCGPAVWTDNRDVAQWNFTCGQFTGCINITFTYDDACDNPLTWTSTFCMEDNTAPICGFPEDLEVNCSDANASLIIDGWLAHEIPTDISHPVTVTNDFDLNATSANCGQATLVTWTYTDACGNASTRDASITINNETAPVIDGVPGDIILGCQDEVPAPATVTATDACGGNASVTFEETTNNGQIIRTWTATDACGNSAVASHTITVGDNEPPTLVGVPNDFEVICTDTPIDPPTVSATDDCSTDLTVNFTETTTAGDCGEIIVRTWSVVDEAGNETTATQTINVVNDENPPVLTGVPADLSLDCGESIPSPAMVSVDDDCTTFSLQYSQVESGDDCTVGYTIIRTWVSVDACGNMVEGVQVITVGEIVDGIQITPPNDVTLECNEDIPTEQPEATTTCPDGELTYEFTDVTTPGSCDGEYSIIRTWTVSDNCGNSEMVEQTYFFEDTTAPVFTFVPGHEDLTCAFYPDGFGTPEIEDNCSDFTIEIVDTFNPYICDADFDISRTWIATDACGNTSSAEQIITIWPDVQAPIFLFVPGNDIIQCPDEAEFGEPEIVDNCLGFDVTIEDEVLVAGECPDGYTVKRTWTAIDECGNTEVQSQTIQVLPAPTIEFLFVPANESRGCGDSSDIEFGEAICQSTCLDGFEMSFEDEVVANCAGSTHTRTWTAIDNCGNTATASQTIEFTDHLAPTFETILVDKTIGCSDQVLFQIPTVTDQCGNINLTFEDTQEWANCEGVAYSTTRVWSAADACGNIANATQTIYVEEDTEAPVFDMTSATYDMTLEEYQNWEMPTPTVSDNCANIVLNNPVAVWKTASVTYTWTATDACENEARVVVKINFDESIFGEGPGLNSDWFSLSPNPATDALTVNFTATGAEDATVIVTDLLGRVWMEQAATATYNGQNTMNLNITDLPVGTYFLILKNNDQEHAQRFLKL